MSSPAIEIYFPAVFEKFLKVLGPYLFLKVLVCMDLTIRDINLATLKLLSFCQLLRGIHRFMVKENKIRLKIYITSISIYFYFFSYMGTI